MGNAWCFADVAVKKFTRRPQLVRIVGEFSTPLSAPSHHANDSPFWVPITSLVLGIICVLSFFDDSQWDNDTIFEIGSFSMAVLVLGAISLNKQKTGKGIVITGIVLSSIALLRLLACSLNIRKGKSYEYGFLSWLWERNSRIGTNVSALWCSSEHRFHPRKGIVFVL